MGDAPGVLAIGVGKGDRGATDRQDQGGDEGNPDARGAAPASAPAENPVGSTHGFSRYPFPGGPPSENFLKSPPRHAAPESRALRLTKAQPLDHRGGGQAGLRTSLDRVHE